MVPPSTGPVLGTRLLITGLSENEKGKNESDRWTPFVDMYMRTRFCVWLGAQQDADVLEMYLAGTVRSPNTHESMAVSTKLLPVTVSRAPP